MGKTVLETGFPFNLPRNVWANRKFDGGNFLGSGLGFVFRHAGGLQGGIEFCQHEAHDSSLRSRVAMRSYDLPTSDTTTFWRAITGYVSALCRVFIRNKKTLTIFTRAVL